MTDATRTVTVTLNLPTVYRQAAVTNRSESSETEDNDLEANFCSVIALLFHYDCVGAVVCQCLSATLSSDPNARIATELKLNELFANFLCSESYCSIPTSLNWTETRLVLAQLVLSQYFDLASRQMS